MSRGTKTPGGGMGEKRKLPLKRRLKVEAGDVVSAFRLVKIRHLLSAMKNLLGRIFQTAALWYTPPLALGSKIVTGE